MGVFRAGSRSSSVYHIVKNTNIIDLFHLGFRNNMSTVSCGTSPYVHCKKKKVRNPENAVKFEIY